MTTNEADIAVIKRDIENLTKEQNKHSEIIESIIENINEINIAIAKMPSAWGQVAINIGTIATISGIIFGFLKYFK